MDAGDENIPEAMRRLDFDDSIHTGCVNDTISNENNIDLTKEHQNEVKKLIHCNVPDNMIPKLDMEFDSEAAAYGFYNSYAKKVGFSIKRLKGHKSNGGVILDRVFSCSCHGKRGKDKRNDNIKRPRAETRFGCLAELGISARLNGRFRVYKFVAEHSHQLATPRKVHMLRSHRAIKEVDKAQRGMAESVGISPKESIDLLAVQMGGRENIGFIPEDYRNYLKTKRTMQIKRGDTGGVLEYLQKMQDEDANFSCAIQVDCQELITNIFWADVRMKLDYGHFGDVVCFDTTYRKNKEGRPLGIFVGANHHKQSVIFGVALLYDETTDTFKWLFNTFARVMSDKKPKTILTDENQAMANALESTWPETCHRLCVWHIYQNAAKHLSGVFSCHRSFVKDFSSCIYDYDEEADFIDAWQKMVAKYNLEDNDWLNKLFEKKKKRALVYGRQTFCADMSTTQRSESINSQVKKYIDYKHDLLQFFHHFQRLVEDRRYEELKADFKACQSTPSLDYPAEILKQAASIYTPTVFNLFRQELWKTWNCNIEHLKDVGTISEYKVSPYEKPYHHVVSFDSSDCKVTCSCRKFEFSGILCAHALKVFSLKNVQTIPTEYILKRWSKDAKVGCPITTQVSITHEDPKIAMGKRFKELSIVLNQLSARAAESGDTYNIAMEGYRKMIEEVEAKLKILRSGELVINPSVGHVTRDEAGKGSSSVVVCGGLAVKGIKHKPKATRIGGSKRIKGALEKAFASKRSHVQKKTSKTKKSKDEQYQAPTTMDGSNISNLMQTASQHQECPIITTIGGSNRLNEILLPSQESACYADETFASTRELHHTIDLNMNPMTDF